MTQQLVLKIVYLLAALFVIDLGKLHVNAFIFQRRLQEWQKITLCSAIILLKGTSADVY